AVDGIKTASHKVKEGVNFVASTAKGLANKIGNLWNKGTTTVKTTFLQGNEKIQHAVKTLLEYKWIPGLGKAYVMPGVGMVREMGQHSLKDAYQYMKSVGEKGVKGTGEGSKSTSGNSKHLSDVKIPSVRNNEFNKWFDNLSAKEFEEMWNNPQLRSKIEDRIRRPGGYHEWHLVARTPKFKQWGISMDDIKEMRSLTKDVEFVNPPGRHGRRGSTKAHNEMLKIIDSASDYESFVKGLNEWAENRMKNGIMDLPEGLRR
ncbi:WXG100 family type VII secretion target, partial [Bacillus thuringiensis]